MKYRMFLFTLIASTTMLMPAFAGEIALPDDHMAVTLPAGWEQMPEKTPRILIRAQAESGMLRFIFTRPPTPLQSAPVGDDGFQHGITQSLIDQGFTKIVRSEVIKVAGADAYLCEASREDKPHSIIQVIWFHEGHALSLVFLSLKKPFKDIPDIQAIIQSVKVSSK